MRYAAGQANRLGNRANNQDRCLVLERDDAVLLVVADGMGGHARGDLAAQACVDTLSRQFRARQALQDPALFLREAFREAHRTIQRVGQTQKPPIEPLTTAVACLIQDGAAQWAHVGDSRAYLIRNNQVALRTRDHTRVAEMVESGLLTEQQARLHPLRNQVSLCLGGRTQPQAALGPTIYLLPGDIVLLCSDGLWSAVSEKRITSMLANENLSCGLDGLVETAVHASHPQSDNVSGVALRWESGRDEQPHAPTADLATDYDKATGSHDPVDRAIADIHQALADYAGEMSNK